MERKERFRLSKVVMALVLGILIGIALLDSMSVSHKKQREHHEAVIFETHK